LPIEQAATSNVCDLYSGGQRSESQLGHPRVFSWPRFFVN